MLNPYAKTQGPLNTFYFSRSVKAEPCIESQSMNICQKKDQKNILALEKNTADEKNEQEYIQQGMAVFRRFHL